MKRILLSLLLLTHFVFASNVVPDASITAVKINAPASYDAFNYILTASVATNALTIALKTNAGTDPTGRDVSKIAFRSATSSSGTTNERSVTSALSIVIPSGTTIGTTSGNAANIYVYAMDNAGTTVLAVSLTQFSNTAVKSSSAISGGATSSVLYSTSAQTSLPIRYLGKILISEATAGTWASGPTTISIQNYIPTDLNSVISSDIGFTTTSTTPVDVTNSSVTLTTSGRPVIAVMTSAASTSTNNDIGFIAPVVATSSKCEGATVVYLFRDGSQILGTPTYDLPFFTGTVVGSGSYTFLAPLNATWYDAVTAGTHTYKLQLAFPTSTCMSGSPSGFISGRLLVYEMPPN